MAAARGRVIYSAIIPVIPTFDPHDVMENIKNKQPGNYTIEEVLSDGNRVGWRITFTGKKTQQILNELEKDNKHPYITQVIKFLREDMQEPYTIALSHYGILNLTKEISNITSYSWFLRTLELEILDSFRKDLTDFIINMQIEQNFPKIFIDAKTESTAISIEINDDDQQIFDKLYHNFQKVIHTVFIDAIRLTRSQLKDAYNRVYFTPKIKAVDVTRVGLEEIEGSRVHSHTIMKRCEFIQAKANQLVTMHQDRNGILHSVISQCEVIQYRMSYVAKETDHAIQDYANHATLSGISYTILAFGAGIIISGIASGSYHPLQMLMGLAALGVGYLFNYKNNAHRDILKKISEIKTEVESMLDGRYWSTN